MNDSDQTGTVRWFNWSPTYPELSIKMDGVFGKKLRNPVVIECHNVKAKISGAANETFDRDSNGGCTESSTISLPKLEFPAFEVRAKEGFVWY